MLSLQRIESGYGESNVLRGVNLEVRPGQVVCLMGRNGVGKTTLMKTLMGLLKTRKGNILWQGRDVTSLDSAKRAKAGIGYVPQGRDIFPQLTVRENLLLGLESAWQKEGVPGRCTGHVSCAGNDVWPPGRRPEWRPAAAIGIRQSVGIQAGLAAVG